jgi:formate dehydrogenase iron-sulfur subunit
VVAEEHVSIREFELAAEPPTGGPHQPHGILGTITYPFRRPKNPTEQEPVGFFTDTTVCIGCKACEVACKEWNLLPADGDLEWHESYDNTAELSATSWRHVKFVERFETPMPPPPLTDAGEFDIRALLAEPKVGQWHLMSDSCKHCVDAPCLNSCPTGAIVHTEFSSVLVQPDICTGCGACVTSCPFGVVATSEIDGHAHKCTLCYDRISDGLTPACAKACPTQSIQFGRISELKQRARDRVETLTSRGTTNAYLYGDEESDTYSALHGFYLLVDEPAAYGLPDNPVNPWIHLGGDYLRAALALALTLGVTALCLILVGN